MSENSETRLSSISKADSFEAIGEFWDTHSSADDWDQGYEVEFEVTIPRRRGINIEADLFARIAAKARRRGISAETLVNLWLAERLPPVKGRARERRAARGERRKATGRGRGSVRGRIVAHRMLMDM